MKVRLSLIVLLTAFTAGCTDSSSKVAEPRANGTGSVGSSSGPTAPDSSMAGRPEATTSVACSPSSAKLRWKGTTRKDVVVGANRMKIGASKQRSIKTVYEAPPATSRVEGLPTGSEWNDWMEQEAAAHDIVLSAVPIPSVSETNQYLKALSKPGAYVGYVGMVEVTSAFAVSCGAAAAIEGQVVTSEHPTTGVLECALRPAPTGLGGVARKYC